MDLAESDPGVFTELITEMGVKGVQVDATQHLQHCQCSQLHYFSEHAARPFFTMHALQVEELYSLDSSSMEDMK